MNKPWTCLRCEPPHKWYGRKPGKPKLCPRCHSPWWETPRTATKITVLAINPVNAEYRDAVCASIGLGPLPATKQEETA